VSAKREKPSNDPTDARAFAAPPKAPPEDLRHLADKLEVLRAGGVASYRREADGAETINLYPSAGSSEDDEKREADRESAAAQRIAADQQRWVGASGGMRPRNGSPITAEMRARLPPR
jgi:hypothetical protein